MHFLNWISWFQLQALAHLKRGKLNEVLMSMGLPDNKIEGSIRLSLGDMTTQEDIDQFKVKFETIYKEIKELLK